MDHNDQRDHAEEVANATLLRDESERDENKQPGETAADVVSRLKIPTDHPLAQILRRIFGDDEQPDQGDQIEPPKTEGNILPADAFRDVAAILWLYTYDLLTRLDMETENGPIHQVARQNTLGASQGNTGAALSAWLQRISAIGHSLDELANRNQFSGGTVDGLHVPPF